MDRREALRTTSFVVGYSLSASAIAAALQGCRTEPGTAETANEADWTPAFLDQEQVQLVAELSETLIPETTTPGAKSVNVHQFIDDELQNFYRPLDQYRFVQGLNDIQARAQAAYGKTFQTCAMNERTELLKRLEEETEKENEAGDPIGRPFFTMLKNMTFQGYFTSERVSKEVLKFDPVPGEFRGCIPLAEVGKLWAID
ncbi:MAG TPA: gluconate 2-dehydrogenase subunit 3 family protein [Saprospiraceae bacterium]|nr:gluconate 2-dehydrogenase subunit 3 family protein [Saprospiraceae bacterium]